VFEGGSDSDDQMGTFSSSRVEVTLAARRTNDEVANLQHQNSHRYPRIHVLQERPRNPSSFSSMQ
jgi:hypothetical protein